MANYVLDLPYKPTAAVTQFTFVKQGASADDTCTPIGATSDLGLGVAQEAASADDVTKGRVIDVRVMGVTVCKSGGTITRGQELKLTATGTVTPVTTAGDIIVGRAMQSASSGDLFNVWLYPSNKHA